MGTAGPTEHLSERTGAPLRDFPRIQSITMAAAVAAGPLRVTFTDDAGNQAGETYPYQVKAIRGEVMGQSSNRLVVAPEPPARPANPVLPR